MPGGEDAPARFFLYSVVFPLSPRGCVAKELADRRHRRELHSRLALPSQVGPFREKSLPGLKNEDQGCVSWKTVPSRILAVVGASL